MGLDQLHLPPAEFDDIRLCDSCTNEFEDGDKLVAYICDTIWMHGERVDLPRIAAQELYCLSCYPNEIPIPHLGTNEGIVLATMEHHDSKGKYSYNRHKLIQGSPSSAGVEWKPNELLEEFHPAPIPLLDYHVTPMYTFVLFRRSGLDLRGFVDGDEVKIPSEMREMITETIELTVELTGKFGYQPENL